MPEINKKPEKCSAVSTMERCMPDFDYSHLTRELRELVIEDIKEDPSKYNQEDIQKVYNDSWFIERYLLRNKLDVRSAHQMIRKALEFRNSPVISITEFPHEFYRIGAIFTYEPDRKGNIPVWMRICVNQKIPIVQQFTKSFLFRVIEEADKRAGGKGIALCFDLQGAGMNNIDMDLLFFVITTLVNYFPKGLSYMLVHELPWVLRSIWGIAKRWLSEDHKDLVKFSDSTTIYEYFEEENLPDFVGGTCKRDYRTVPSNSITLSQAAKQWNLNEEECFKIKRKFADHLPPDEEEAAY
uniref:Motile sperm domain-containing protein 2 n=1 Tax=Aceria tosichella TaxID=561515 RepID=A0A6G1S5M7_9ACAR